MATREEIKAKILPRLIVKHRAAFSWQGLVTAVSGTTPAQKQDLIAAIRAGSANSIGTIILRMAQERIEGAALATAEEMLADGALTLDELDQVL